MKTFFALLMYGITIFYLLFMFLELFVIIHLGILLLIFLALPCFFLFVIFTADIKGSCKWLYRMIGHYIHYLENFVYAKF